MISFSDLMTSEKGSVFSPVFATLHATAFAETARWTEDAFTQLFATPGTEALLASVEEEPVGFILVRSVLDEAEILTLAVVPEWRRHGIARKLLQRLEQELDQKQVRKLFLEVSTTNTPAKKLYTSTGFITAGIRKRYYEDGSDAIVMAREITKA
ncbi:ribosomal-protein-alanine N-acetyltransferase [Acetobacter aceti]|uniref:[Ribosomal protein bS18]-alanine N-acetyltransferase n=2 Tax=Acetobacter aceti TaxID=435 RepID=A0A1U9KJU5_ACEAC|nr:ribosomal-protein-alanine N-acetyltransferase [Acetobacter aceti]